MTEAFTSTLLGFFSGAAPESAASAAIRSYFSEKKTGTQFEYVVDDDPNEITARDIVAVSTLSVTIPAPVAIWLLSEEGRATTRRHLSAVPSDVDLWDAPELVRPDGQLWSLWDILSSASWPTPNPSNDMGHTKISKLLAAKRPRLMPILDSVVQEALPGDTYWADFLEALSDPAVRNRIEVATADAPSHLSLLRKIDIVVWTLNR